MYETGKGSDYIGDQDAIEYMCSVGPQAVFELEHMGLPFSRTEEGRIYQRPFGGQSKGPDNPTQAARTCAAADRTGHALLHALYQGNLKGGTTFLNEWYAVDLVKNSKGQVAGVIAIDMETGETVYIKAKATVLATGGAGRIYQSTTNALINTGDGVGMAIRAGVPMQDIEMWQFHPTGIAQSICCRLVNTARAASSQYRCFRFNVNSLTCLHINRDNTGNLSLRVFNQINRIPFV
jgi:succinate dehydrogenase / fumarate reductase flavoprotein subunit